LLKAFSIYRAACELIFAMLEFDPLALETLMEALEDSSTAKVPAVLDRINHKLAHDWENLRAGAKRAAGSAAQGASEAAPESQMKDAS
jgi:hypothetical protein